MLLLLALACSPDIALSENARCDGALQPSEETVDDAFDSDADGFFDGANPECAETYAAESLDCDDGDPLVNPEEAEACGDGVDNDCDGEADPACSFSGAWTVEPPVSYACAYDLVQVGFTSLQVFDADPSVSFGATGAQPGTMSGLIDEDATFQVENTLAGACTETYRLQGAFDSATSFTATFTATFTGDLCIDCTNQSWELTGTLAE